MASSEDSALLVVWRAPAMGSSARGAALQSLGADVSGERAGRPRASMMNLRSIIEPAAGSEVRMARET